MTLDLNVKSAMAYGTLAEENRYRPRRRTGDPGGDRVSQRPVDADFGAFWGAPLGEDALGTRAPRCIYNGPMMRRRVYPTALTLLAATFLVSTPLAGAKSVRRQAQPRHIAVGTSHSCVLTDTNVWCWGANDFGQLGTGPSGPQERPVRVAGVAVMQITAGYGHTCAVLVGGGVACWGDNTSGQLGDGTKSRRARPTLVEGLPSASAVHAGRSHTCAVTPKGAVYCWGDNSLGAVGDGSTLQRLRPALAVHLSGVTALAAGSFSCGLEAGGLVKCWGMNFTATPTAVPLEGAIPAIEDLTGCARDAKGATRCWGAGTSGQLGSGDHRPWHRNPEPIKLPKPAKGLAVAQSFACAHLADDTLLCWGAKWGNPKGFAKKCLRSTNHSSGGGSAAQWRYCPTPTKVPGLGPIVDVDAGGERICAIHGGRAVKITCWGRDHGPKRVRW